MAGQGIERRAWLRAVTAAASVAAVPGFERWCFAFQSPEGGAQIRPAAYAPRFFTSAEFPLLERLVEIVIPGAGPAGAAEFIDVMAASDPALQFPFRYGLDWIDAHSRGLHGAPFLSVPAAQQTALLVPLAYRDHHRTGEEDGRAFFHLLRQYTVMGYYTTRAGMEELDDPSLRFYSESPGCPDPSDPAHLHSAPAART